ncbi:MAG: glutamine--tRNA ligase/YqeY domain fusion protein [Acidobacteria bacterium]|nr:glutamine--tRNA ligase/YqeY domain fusion protein [Acidobacteriota bacterium]
MSEQTAAPVDFVRKIIIEHNRSGRFDGRVHTRFPPEPNAYLHIGHAKSSLLNSSIAQEFGGRFNLRFDDTNPEKEEQEFVDAIKRDLKWLGVDWEDREFYASDCFEKLYGFAVELIKKGKAYVDSLSAEEISRLRGTAVKGQEKIETRPGEESPYRNRSVEENLDLLERMRDGEFDEGAHVLRAKIDMGHPNLNMRDPVMYRILKASHHRTGDRWNIYPTYDWAHGQSDSIEGITHSICTLEFEDHRPLYDWYLNALGIHHPQQIEFARLNLTYTVLSKRRLLQIIRGGHVRGWDDPRMPTLVALRRRGFTPEAIRNFIRRIGVAKADSMVDFQHLEYAVREHLNRTAQRAMAVLRPVKVVIENYPDDRIEEMDLMNNPEDPSAGTRKVPFSKEIWIERGDFMEDPPKKFFRLSPGREVRLRRAYYITCTGVEKDASGEVTLLRCTYDPATRGGDSPDKRKVRGTLHWVSVDHALDAEVRIYDHLFTTPDPDAVDPGKTWLDNLNPQSLEVLTGCKVESPLAGAAPGSRFQFERQGYFCVDPDSTRDRLVFNRTVTLKDTWAKIQKQQG